jgi:hypothetical protein
VNTADKLEDPGVERKMILKWVLKKQSVDVDWSNLAQGGPAADSCKHVNETFWLPQQ